MGSRLMHAVIGYQVSEALDVEDKSSFLLGAIAADATTNKRNTHYFKGDVKTYSREADYDLFLSENTLDTAFELGYFTHIVADDLWLDAFYIPWLSHYMEKDPKNQNYYYKDFEILNYLLSEKYPDIKEFIEKLENDENHPIIRGIEPEHLNLLLEALKEDVNGEKTKSEDLTVFSFHQINGYINTVVKKCLFLIQEYQKLDS